jgi:hypothetical protein
MTTPTAIEVNCETGIVTERPLTADEIAANETAAAQAEATRLAHEESQTALAALKASAKAKLIAGKPLTAEEADTLVI